MISDHARRRLGKVAALLASDQDGEVLNAARMLVRGLAELGARPEDVFEPAPMISERRIDAWVEQAIAEAARVPAAPPPAHVAVIDQLLNLRWRMTLTRKSERLLVTLKRQLRLSPEEQSWLDDLSAKLAALRAREVASARNNLAEDYA